MATDEFDPRRAEPGQEFGYTGNDVRVIGEDDEIPEGYELRGYDPGLPDDDGKLTPKRTIVREGVQKTFTADDSGIVHPKNEEEARIADAYGLPVARSAAKKEAEEKKSEAPKKEG